MSGIEATVVIFNISLPWVAPSELLVLESIVGLASPSGGVRGDSTNEVGGSLNGVGEAPIAILLGESDRLDIVSIETNRELVP
jgi:hypothetical protein